MLTKHTDHTISFSTFTDFPELICVMSTRKLGDLNVGKKPLTNALPLLQLHGLTLEHFVAMNQVHKDEVVEVSKKNGNTLIPKTDAIMTTEKNVYLSVKGADCVPLFFYEPVARLIAVAHAGWRGTLLGISTNVIKKMQMRGGNPKQVRVAIGPHIGGCCYTVPRERAQQFEAAFGDPRVVFESRDQWYVDLGQANAALLQETGVQKKNIDVPIFCTSCQSDRFFSYRRDRPEMFGEMLGIIGMKN